MKLTPLTFQDHNYSEVDNRLMSLQLIKNGMTQAVMFGPDGKNILPAAILYKKNILALRGSFRPVTKVNIDMYEKSLDIFKKEKKVDEDNTIVILKLPCLTFVQREKLMRKILWIVQNYYAL